VSLLLAGQFFPNVEQMFKIDVHIDEHFLVTSCVATVPMAGGGLSIVTSMTSRSFDGFYIFGQRSIGLAGCA